MEDTGHYHFALLKYLLDICYIRVTVCVTIQTFTVFHYYAVIEWDAHFKKIIQFFR